MLQVFQMNDGERGVASCGRWGWAALALMLIIVAGMTGVATPAAAEMRSEYTELNLNRCALVDKAEEGEGEWATFRCPGIKGMSVYVSEADLRISLGYGERGRDQQSFNQRLAPFNSIGGKLEWRLSGNTIIATILRYITETGSEGKKGQILVVSKLSGDGSEACHVAYVDALANPAANNLARFAADNIAPGFRCGSHTPTHIGKRGVSPF